MRKFSPYLVALLLIFSTLMPPVGFDIRTPPMGPWTLLVLYAAFLGFTLLFLPVNWFIRAFAILGFLNCFFSVSPFISFSAYISLVGCCYFYYLCLQIKDWEIIFKTFLILLMLNGFLMAMQFIGRDTLLNFGNGHASTCFGVIGNRMQFESVLIVICAFVLQSKYRFIIPGVLILYLMVHPGHVLHNPFTARIPCWVQTLALANQTPWTGWGIGTFKILGPPLIKNVPQVFRQTHNDYLQVLFETGCPGLLLFLSYIGWITYQARKDFWLECGIVLIALSMTIHFPMREFQTFLILIAFAAYCDIKVRA